jgi:hypothetical protein
LCKQTQKLLVGPEHDVLRILSTSNRVSKLPSVFSLRQRGLSLGLVQPELSLSGEVSSQIVGADVVKLSLLEFIELLPFESNSLVAQRVEVVDILVAREFRLKLNAFSPGPFDVVAERFPTVLVEIWLGFWQISGNDFLHSIFNLSVDCLSLGSNFGAVLTIKSKHVVIGPTIHLDGKDGGLVG